jgi:eukaryotic-like serine/threonine-protein kinase
MGEVYQARDPRLDRDVAIKVLSASVASDLARFQRFVQEARSVAALSHPNILAVFDIGMGEPPYIVTELLDGETLRDALRAGPLAQPRVLEIGLAIAAGLQAAHSRGIIHRDLKPENVFLTKDRGVKILDFGLAKVVVRGAVDEEARTIADATEPGTVMGTVGYMSPEQVRGHAADARSDIFALGAVLFEMVSGRRAFKGVSPADTMSAVLREQPEDLSLNSGTPASIARIVQRALAKNSADRFQSVADFRLALESAADTRPAAESLKSDENSVAVLPFANMSADPDNQFFSDGLAEELINALGRLPGLKVASRTSAYRFRGSDVDIRDIGRQLQVRTVLEGSVRRAGARLRVTAQLVNIADGYRIWSERFDREMADVFDIQDEIVGAIVAALAPALAGEARGAVRRPTDNVAAYELYLRGRHAWHLRTPANLHSALKYFEQVTALDADYALAYAGGADCYSVFRVYGWYPAAKWRQQARDAVARAVSLDPSLPEVAYSQALFAFYFDRNNRSAETHLRRALQSAPHFTEGHAYLGLVLSSMQRAEEAIAAAERARHIDPLSPLVHYLASSMFLVLGRAEDAERSARRMLELQPDSLAGLWLLALSLSCQGQHTEAVPAAERVLRLSRAPFYVGVLGYVYASAGRVEDARQLLAELQEREQRGEYLTPVALFLIALGMRDTASLRTALKACIADETPALSLQVCDPITQQQLRADAEIDRLLQTLYDNREQLRS